MKTRITTLSENSSGMGNFISEWGLSVLIEADNTRLLFDTSPGNSIGHNTQSLGVDLTKIDKIVLSHGHYDHTGGLREVLRKTQKAIEVIAHPDIWQPKYDIRGKNPPRYIGIPFQRAELESLGACFNLTPEPVTISQHIMTSGEVPMTTEFENIDPSLFVKSDGKFEPDAVLDDQAIFIKTDKGLVVILGCAHRGMINTLYHAQKIMGVDTIHAVLGGSHLVSASQERLWQTIAALKELKVEKLGLCHCTDLPAISVLATEFGENFIFNRTGSAFSFK